MYDGPIVDSHHHLWEWRNYPWLVAPITPKMYGSNYQPLRQDAGHFARAQLLIAEPLPQVAQLLLFATEEQTPEFFQLLA